MGETLVPCESCQRHLLASATVCPFCGAPASSGAPEVQQASEERFVTLYGAPPPPFEVRDAPVYGAPPEDLRMALLYGAPPSPFEVRDAPLYGGPPPALASRSPLLIGVAIGVVVVVAALLAIFLR